MASDELRLVVGVPEKLWPVEHCPNCGAIRNKSRASDRSADLADRSNTAIFTKLSDD